MKKIERCLRYDGRGNMSNVIVFQPVAVVGNDNTCYSIEEWCLEREIKVCFLYGSRLRFQEGEFYVTYWDISDEGHKEIFMLKWCGNV